MNILFSLLAGALVHAQGVYNVDPAGITLSGPSAGAHMAVQMDIAYSQTFSGAGSIAGGIYWCAKGDSNIALTTCMGTPDSIKIADFVSQTNQWAAAGAIDATANLARHQYYLYASPSDTVVNPDNTTKLEEFLENYVDASHVHTDFTTYSAHGFPTLASGGLCQFPGLPWLLDCDHDSAGLLLQAMYGSLQPRGQFVPQHLLKFAQNGTGLDKYGWIYVPASCAAGALCKLHVALHGCEMNPDFIGDQFVTEAGYNEWAETNNILVLYPQAAVKQNVNPFACWDWVGGSGKDYAVKSGVEMVALKQLIDSVRGL